MNAMIVRDAEESDLPAILTIYNQAVLHSTASADYEPHTSAMRAAWFAQRSTAGYPVLIAEADGEVLGWASLGPFHSRIAYQFTAENSVYIAEHARGRGIGTTLLRELVARAEAMREPRIHAIVALITAGNESSVRMHAGCGFQECGRLPQMMWKFGQWLDLVYMVKLIQPAAS